MSLQDPLHPEIAERLLAYADGELPPDQAREISGHLDGCEACRAELDELRKTASFLQQALEPARLSPGERQRLEQQTARPPASPRRRAPVWVRGVAALLLATVIGMLYFEGREGDTQYATVVVSSSLRADSPASVALMVHDHQTNKALSGAPVNVWLVANGKRIELGKTTSDANGLARVNFHVPDLAAGTYAMHVSTSSWSGSDELVRQVTVTRGAQLLVTADKPLYQPGQTIQVKALARRVPSLKPDAGRPLTFTLVDPRGNKVYKQIVAASKFGIASVSIPLADEVTFGRYRIQVTPGSDAKQTVERVVTIKRYVLPPFRIDVRQLGERSWAMPGQALELEVSARYHFGKPVSGGTLAFSFADPLMRWRGDLPRGLTLDAKGKARVKISLPTRMRLFGRRKQMVRVRLGVSVIDQARHTEHRIHPVLIARHPVLIDAIPAGGYRAAGNTKQDLLISTIRPDGSPVACTLEVAGQKAATGKLGLARLAVETASAQEIVATTAEGERAAWRYSPNLWQPRSLILRTDRTLYRTGEKLQLTVAADQRQGTVFVDLIKDQQTFYTGTAQLENSRAAVELPLSSELAGVVTINAYTMSSGGEAQRCSQQIFVSRSQELSIEARLVDATSGKAPAKRIFRPGQHVTYEFRLTDAKGQPVVGALSTSIVDRAVLALAESTPGMAAPIAEFERGLLQPRAQLTIYRQIRPRALLTSTGAGGQTAEREDAAQFLLSRATAEVPRRPTIQTDWQGKLRRAEQVRRQARQYLQPLAMCLPLILFFWAFAVFPVFRKVILTCSFVVVFLGFVSVVFLDGGDDVRQIFFTSSSSLREGAAQDLRYDYGYTEGNKKHDTKKLMGAGGVGVGGGWDNSPRPKALRVTAGPPRKSELSQPLKQARVRRRFVETLLWVPELITDEKGVARKRFQLADNLTGWRTLVEAVDGGGRTGSSETGFVTFQPFMVRPDLPVQLTQGDRVEIPIALHNYARHAQTIQLALTGGDWFTLEGQQKRSVTLQPGEVTVRYFPITVTRFGLRELTVTGRGTDYADGARKEILVLPDGEKLTGSVSARLSSGKRTVTLPPEGIEGTRRLWLKVYPGVAAEAISGLAGMIRMPHG